MQTQPQELAVLSNVMLYALQDLVSRGVLTEMPQPMVARLSDFGSLVGYLTSSLPKLGKALDAFLASDCDPSDANRALEATAYGLLLEHFGSSLPGLTSVSRGPSGLREYVTPSLVRELRQVSYLFYKYEVPHPQETVLSAINTFVETDEGLSSLAINWVDIADDAALMERLFRGFDPQDIHPSHGPGAVSDRSVGGEKYQWRLLPTRLVNQYSYEYFSSCFDQLAEELDLYMGTSDEEPKARLLTVPKDSRGPRVISCEPKELLWIQQGIMRAMVDWIEHHPLTRDSVRFTDQSVNGKLALEGSVSGKYATLDLSEASDRVALEYVERVFPDPLKTALLATRSLSTVLPCGREVRLMKFAPMGSALCFPVLALTVWARLKQAGLHGFHVYGDDVIVNGSDADTAITALETVGLKVNRNKSCTRGFFRESCGVDAYRGTDVTPMRCKKRWPDRRQNASEFIAWVSYANSFFARGYPSVANYIAVQLTRLFGPLPQSWEGAYNVPSFTFLVDNQETHLVKRTNRQLQRLEYKVISARPVTKSLCGRGWIRLLHWFAAKGSRTNRSTVTAQERESVSACTYTARRSTVLQRKWKHLVLVTRASGNPNVFIRQWDPEVWNTVVDAWHVRNTQGEDLLW